MAEGVRCCDAAVDANVAPGIKIWSIGMASMLNTVAPQVVWLRILQKLELDDTIVATDRAKACDACLTEMRQRICAEYRERQSLERKDLERKDLEVQLDAAEAVLQKAVQAEAKAERQCEETERRLKAAVDNATAKKKVHVAAAALSTPVVRHRDGPL